MGLNNVQIVVDSHLCHGCGSCFPVCNQDAISVKYSERYGMLVPEVHIESCNDCGLCRMVCAGEEVDFPKLMPLVSDQKAEHPWLGVYTSIITGYSHDPELRFNASTGGGLSEFLIFLLKKGYIDGAIVADMSEEDPLKSKVVIATTPEQIISAKGSKYCPVPMNAMVHEAAKTRKKYAFVGLPCHIHSLRKTQLINKRVKAAFPYVLGLMCSNVSNYHGTEFFLERVGIDKNEVAGFKYRGDGWLGKISVTLKSGEVKKFSKTDNTIKEAVMKNSAFHTCFSLERCLTCTDHNAELADIVFGDARLAKYLKEDKIGTSLIVTRNEKTQALLDEAIKDGNIIKDMDFDVKTFFKAQKHSFKEGYVSHLWFNKLIGRKNPEYKYLDNRKTKFSLLRILEYMPSYLSHHKRLSFLFIPYEFMLKYVFNWKFFRYLAARSYGTIKKTVLGK